MRQSLALGLLVTAALAAPASAMDRYGTVGAGSRASVADPDRGIDRLAAASTPTPGGHGRSTRSARNVLRDDANLRNAYAWVDNK